MPQKPLSETALGRWILAHFLEGGREPAFWVNAAKTSRLAKHLLFTNTPETLSPEMVKSRLLPFLAWQLELSGNTASRTTPILFNLTASDVVMDAYRAELSEPDNFRCFVFYPGYRNQCFSRDWLADPLISIAHWGQMSTPRLFLFKDQPKTAFSDFPDKYVNAVNVDGIPISLQAFQAMPVFDQDVLNKFKYRFGQLVLKISDRGEREIKLDPASTKDRPVSVMKRLSEAIFGRVANLSLLFLATRMTIDEYIETEPIIELPDGVFMTPTQEQMLNALSTFPSATRLVLHTTDPARVRGLLLLHSIACGFVDLMEDEPPTRLVPGTPQHLAGMARLVTYMIEQGEIHPDTRVEDLNNPELYTIEKMPWKDNFLKTV